jgi:uncharacterized RDD family membrane protein YckC
MAALRAARSSSQYGFATRALPSTPWRRFDAGQATRSQRRQRPPRRVTLRAKIVSWGPPAGGGGIEMESASTCPKCGNRRESGRTECPYCGVIYSKVEERNEAAGRGGAGSWGGPGPLAGGGAATGHLWGDPVPAGGAWEAAPTPPARDGLDLYRPPSAPAAEGWLHARAAADLAGRGSRLVAQLLDVVVAVALVLVAGFSGQVLLGPGERAAQLTLGVFVVGAVALVAVNLRLLYRHGQTIGKMLLGIRIVRLDGERAGLARLLLLRSLVPGILGAVPYLGMLFALVDALFIFRDDRRCLHDHLADTKVIARA